MQNGKKKKCQSIWILVCFIVWLVINIRVEAGMGTSFERAIDGLVGGVVLLVSIFFALRFFSCIGDGCMKGGRCSKDQ